MNLILVNKKQLIVMKIHSSELFFVYVSDDIFFRKQRVMSQSLSLTFRHEWLW